MNELSQRLNQVYDLIPRSSQVLADIGTDHAQLPIYLASEHDDIAIIAGEVNEGPFQAASIQIAAFGMTNRIDLRFGSGLEIITEDDKVDTLTIAGMGAKLIVEILNKDHAKLKGVNHLILQPNVHEYLVREFAVNNQFEIKEEAILKEDEYIYEVIHLEKGNSPITYCEDDILFGPHLRFESNDTFKEKWTNRIKHHQQTIDQMKQAKSPDWDKIKKFSKQINRIEEVLSQ